MELIVELTENPDVINVITSMPIGTKPDIDGELVGNWLVTRMGDYFVFALVLSRGQHMFDELEEAYYTNDGCYEL